jgi:hypothetical protein
MSTFGWVFMLLYWGGLTFLLVFCLRRTLAKD